MSLSSKSVENGTTSHEKNVAVEPEQNDATSGQTFRLVLLILMVIQNTSAVLLTQYTRASVSKEECYVVNHVIVICETVKVRCSPSYIWHKQEERDSEDARYSG